MITKILIPIDGSELSFAAAEEALSLAARIDVPVVAYYASAPYTVTYMADYAVPNPITEREHKKASKEYASRVFDKMKEMAAQSGVALSSVTSESSFAHEGVLAAAKKTGADLIVIGSHGRGPIGQIFMGSVAMRIVAQSDVPVLIIRRSKKKARAK